MSDNNKSDTFDDEGIRQYVLDLTQQCDKKSNSCYELGKFYLMGLGNRFPPDFNKAVEFLIKGCDNESGKSCCLLSGIYREQNKPSQSKKYWLEAQRLLTRDCEIKNQPNACMFWGLELLANSNDPIRDYPVALKILERGCKLNQPVCCLNAGVILLNYIKNTTKARQYFEKACSLENGDACWLLGEEIEKTSEKKDLESTNYYKKACDLGCLEGCVAHGTDMIQQGKYDKAMESLTKACDKGEPNGCLLGGIMLLSTKNTNHAKQLFTKGCHLQNQECCEYLEKY